MMIERLRFYSTTEVFPFFMPVFRGTVQREASSGGKQERSFCSPQAKSRRAQRERCPLCPSFSHKTCANREDWRREEEQHAL